MGTLPLENAIIANIKNGTANIKAINILIT